MSPAEEQKVEQAVELYERMKARLGHRVGILELHHFVMMFLVAMEEFQAIGKDRR